MRTIRTVVCQRHLTSLLVNQGLSQAELAKLVGVSRNTISSIETGRFYPTAKLALILCIALDVRFEDLFFLPTEPSTLGVIFNCRWWYFTASDGGVPTVGAAQAYSNTSYMGTHCIAPINGRR